MRSIFIIAAFSIPISAHAATFTSHTPTPTPPIVFTDTDGNQHALRDYRGTYVLLNIWATWCAPCTHEMPSLDMLPKIFDSKKLRIIALSEDRSESVVSVFYKTHNIKNLSVSIDNAGIAPSIFKLNGIPTSLLIDPQGNEIARLEGEANWSAPELTSYLATQIH